MMSRLKLSRRGKFGTQNLGKTCALQIAATRRSKFSREISGSALFTVDGLNERGIGGKGDRHIPHFHSHQ
jgi:hypothetical protein